MKHFFSKIDFIMPESNEPFLAGRCIKILHGVYSRQRIKGVGVAFPDWSLEGPGSSIAFVSQTPEHIETLVSQNYFQEMRNLGYFNIHEIKEHETSSMVIYSRNQGVTKITPAGIRRRLRRHKKRAQERGEIYKPNLTGQVFNLTNVHRIPIASKSTGQEFSLYVQQCPINENRAISGGVNSYGLSNTSANNFPVPRFNH